MLVQDMKEHVAIHVTGKVQGVFFRHSTKLKAEGLGLHGYIRNQPDGSVFIEAEGDSEDLQELVRWCEEGPPEAEVVQVTVEPGGLQHFMNFEIRS